MIQNCCALGEYKNITFHALYDKFEERMWKIRNKRLWLRPHYQINGENSEGVHEGGVGNSYQLSISP